MIVPISNNLLSKLSINTNNYISKLKKNHYYFIIYSLKNKVFHFIVFINEAVEALFSLKDNNH